MLSLENIDSYSNNKTFWWNVLAMFYGGALGDALGLPFEFRYSLPISKYHGKLEYRPVKISRYYGKRYGVIGQISDDTDMTLALCYAIIESGNYNPDTAVLNYQRWANSKPFGMGRNTRLLFKGITTIKGYRNRQKKLFAPTNNPESNQSNGSLMRCAPLSLFPGKDYQNVILDVNLTNPNDVNREIGILYVKILRELLFGNTGLKVLEEATQPDVIKVIHQARKHETRDVISTGKGWVVNSFYCAIYCLLHFDDYMEAIGWVIRLGGDTDTNAAISGNLMGAKIGHRLLTDSRVQYNLQILLNADPSDGDIPRSEKYHVSQFNDIVIDFANISPEIELENNNIDNFLYFLKKGHTPILVNKKIQENGDQVYLLYFLLQDSRIITITITQDEDGLYIVQSIHSEKKELDIKKLSGNSVDLFESYHLLSLFIETLRDRALGEINAKMRILDPLDRNYDILYGHNFFPLNK